MKKFSKILKLGLALCLSLTSFQSFSQIVGTEAYIIGDYVEVGINADGHEGAPDLAGSNARSSAWAGSDVYFGFVANPQMDGWTDYDGDFFSPGSPENGFGLEIDGVNYSNNASGWPVPQIPGSITSYDETGDCITVDWDGSIMGVDINVKYKLVTSNVYYTTTVTLTNTTGGTLNDVYYYRNFDPDNNHSIGGGFPTQNTLVANPTPTCEKAYVTAEQTAPWDSYVGMGGLGQNFRVTYGGFSNRDASDIWNGTAPFTDVAGSTTFSDIGISLAYKIETFNPGDVEEFSFVIVMDEPSYDAAMSSLYYLDYVSGGGTIDECSPTIDTLEICPGGSEVISVDGPSSGLYDWVWTPPLGLSTTIGTTTTASPAVTTTYTVTGTPLSCATTPIVKDIVVDLLSPPAGPDAVDIACNSGDVLDLDVHLIPEALGMGAWEESTTPASGSFDDVTGEFDATGLDGGDYVFDYIVVTLPPCPADTATITVTVIEEVEAGDDNIDNICNHPGSVLDLTSLLLGADAGGSWTEGVFSGGFDGINSFDADGLAPDDYTFTYTLLGTAPCPDDDASFIITVLPKPTVDAGSDIDICDTESATLIGAGVGISTYIWDNGVIDGVPFVPTTTTTYTVIGIDDNGCFDSDEVDITVHPIPTVNFVADTVIGCDPFLVQFTSLVSPAPTSCTWDFGDGNTSTSCGITSNEYEYEGLYDVRLDVVSDNGCTNYILIDNYIEVINTPIASFNYRPYDPVINDTEVDFENNSIYSTSYIWDFGDGATSNLTDPTHEFPNVGDVSYLVGLTAENDLGCSHTVYRTINVKDIIVFYIPNSFTPDGDEYNETFKPVFTSGVDPYDFHMVVYNRWGEVVFESYNPASGWDGTYGNRGIIHDGSYVWEIDFKETMSDKRHKHRGHVTILK
ncbi:MAG: putative gliding motility-associated protein [uncultured marine phage]|uniref:Putative gliding motility-associated protein n=1 Tax=uncultured marine phage TaxID=707152 RepID=A0A8D9CF46_9VIRU|nr:MAG: putative gliding motility-associated protein [uncultured marine phage]